MRDNLISILMSTYNEPDEWIRYAIDSILNQTYNNIEFIIICDNPKNKDLISLLDYYEKADKRIKVIYNDVNIGLTKSLNKAIERATGEYIARMDCDDISNANRLEEQLKYLQSNSLDLIGSAVECINENGDMITKLNNLPEKSKDVNKRIIYNNCLPHPSWFGKVEIFKELNGYRNVSYAEDYDFLLRAVYKGFKLGNLNNILLKYRMRESSISNQNGLKQFVTSQVLIDSFKAGYILEYDKLIEKIRLKLDALTIEEERKYSMASKVFSDSVKSKNLIKLTKSLMISKNYRRKILCYVKGLI